MWSFCHVFPMLEEYQMAGRGQAPIGHLFIQGQALTGLLFIRASGRGQAPPVHLFYIH
jgi:hypothetical protein